MYGGFTPPSPEFFVILSMNGGKVGGNVDEILKVTKDIRTIDKSIAKLKSSSSKHKIKRTKYASPSLHAVSSDSDEEILPINSSSHESLPPKTINMPETLTSEAQPPIITADINRPVVLTPFLRQPKVPIMQRIMSQKRVFA